MKFNYYFTAYYHITQKFMTGNSEKNYLTLPEVAKNECMYICSKRELPKLKFIRTTEDTLVFHIYTKVMRNFITLNRSLVLCIIWNTLNLCFTVKNGLLIHQSNKWLWFTSTMLCPQKKQYRSCDWYGSYIQMKR